MRITEQWFVCENANCKPLTFPGVRTDPGVHQAGRGVVKKYRMAEGQKPPTCWSPQPEESRTWQDLSH